MADELVLFDRPGLMAVFPDRDMNLIWEARVPGGLGQAHEVQSLRFSLGHLAPQTLRLRSRLAGKTILEVELQAGESVLEGPLPSRLTLPAHGLIRTEIDTPASMTLVDCRLALRFDEPGKPCGWCNGSGVGLHPVSYREIPGGCTHCGGSGRVPLDTPQTFL